MDFKKSILDAILKAEPAAANIQLETPPDDALGDYAFPCFRLAKELKKAPNQIAEDIAQALANIEGIKEIKSTGPYVNFFIDPTILAKETLAAIKDRQDEYGVQKETSKKVLVESPGPNTNKPLHLGHLRNILLGTSIQNILKANGHDARIVNVVNDRGVHICKSMLAYQKFGNNQTPEDTKQKSDHFVGSWYVEYAKQVEAHPEMEQEIQDMLVKWEENDKPTRELWKTMNDWALKGFDQTYKRLKLSIEKEYYESNTYENGKDIVKQAADNGIFQKRDDNAITIDLEQKKLGTKVLLRPNGTSVYITQDIAMAKQRYDEYSFDSMVYIVGNEQEHHFKVLFEIFKKLDWPIKDSCHHLSYGMIELPSGKMKSREGNVIDTDTLLDDMYEMATEEIKARHQDLEYEELNKRAEMISMGAVRFFFLKHNPKNNFIFRLDESLNMEGETGPYVMYAHARAFSILEKLGNPTSSNAPAEISDPEKKVIKLLSSYPTVVNSAAEEYDPSQIAHFLLGLAQSFNSFYHECPIKDQEESVKQFRLQLVEATRQVLKNALGLLGIEAPERM